MKFVEIKDLTSDELRKKHTQLRDELFEAKMKHSLGQVGNPIEIRERRRDIARVLTAINVKLGDKPAAPVAKKRTTKTAKRKE
jgi:large subunit ribosomal protein L29